MARSRRRDATSRDEAHRRQREQNDRARAERDARDRRRAAYERLGGSANDGLGKLGALSERLEELHAEESKILDSRDLLIADLRTVGTSWNLIALRSGVSRQALSKRALDAR